MSAEVGQFALILALLLAVVQSAAPLWGAARGDGVLMAVGRAAARPRAISVRSPRPAPQRGAADWTSASSKARISAN